VDVALELIKEKKPRGIVFLGGFFSHSKEKLEQLTVPFVLSTIGMTDSLEESSSYSWVSVDDYAESYKMTDYLCKLGHKRILILAATQDDESIGKLRLEGYKKALEDNGIELDEKLCIFSEVGRDCYTMDYGFMSMSRILKEKKVDFTAVYAISDSIAIGACKAITECGGKVPEDYSVAGFDGLDIAHYYNPTLTTIRQPVEEMAKSTIRILFDVIGKKADHQKRVFKGELVEGESTRRI
jgi:LacI family transcriptional regulator